MTSIFRLFILHLFIGQSVYGQTSTLIFTNNTGRTVHIYSTHYRADSTKSAGTQLCLSLPDNRPCGTLSNYTPSPYLGDIRLNVIAVDDSTKDTVYVKSFTKEQLNSGAALNIDITNSINPLPPDLVTLPFLQITARGFRKEFKTYDPIDLKLQNRQKIQGTIQSFDKQSITLIDSEKKTVTIQKRDVVGIKSCERLWAMGAWASSIKHCKYARLKAIKFTPVRQVLSTKPYHFSYEWQEW